MRASTSRESDLAVASPGGTEIALATALAVASLAFLTALTPFARVPLAPVRAFVPAYESALTVCDFITAVILFAHFGRAKSVAVLILAGAYLFEALIILPHMLTFPGVFSPNGLLGAGSQTTSWLYTLWHGGYALYLFAFATVRRVAPDLRARRIGRPLVLGLFANALLVALLVVLVTAGADWLPVIVRNGDYSLLVAKGISPAICALCGAAILLLWTRRRIGALDLWLMVAASAWLCDTILGAVVSSARFDLGWYAGRMFGLLANLVMLVLLMVEFSRLDQKLSSRTLELRASEALRQAFFEYSSECFAILERSGEGPFRFAEVNAATLALYRRPRGEVIGRTSIEVLGEAQGREIDAVLDACLRAGAPRRYERAQGDRFVEALATPVPRDEAPVERVIVSARDITERRQLEEQLRQSQKMEAIGQLTGGVAHDFNNMLAIVMGSLDMARRRLASGAHDQLGRWLDNAAEGATRAATLTSRLLSYSRRQPLDPKVVDVNALVSGMSQLLRQTISEAIVIETALAADLWKVFADPGQIENGIVNLAVNARDAMPEGGRITIETRNVELDDRYARQHPDVRPGQYVMVGLTDTGAGMTEEVKARAFEPFFSTKPPGQGTGLGLSQIFGFAKQSNGHVAIASELGRGTTVRLYLPRHVGAGEALAPAAAPDLAPARGQLILVVEDEAAVRQVSEQALQELGYRTLAAGGADEALQILSQTPQIELLFTDVVMPGLTGRQLADEARRARPGLKVLYTTGYARDAIVHNGVLDPGAHLLPKPFSVEDLAAKVAQLLSA